MAKAEALRRSLSEGLATALVLATGRTADDALEPKTHNYYNVRIFILS